MKTNRILHMSTFTLATLLGLTAALAAPVEAAITAADFPATVPFERGATEFLPGDSITIQQVRGTSATIRTGETYYVEGTYTLASRDQADLAVFATTASAVSTPTDPSQITRVKKGTGTFRLVKTMRGEGYLHLSFYPVPGGSAFGGIYFGQGEGVLKNKGWSYFDKNTASPDYTTSGSPAEETVVLKGPNQAIFKYLGAPVPPPADMNPAYSKPGLIKAIQTAAQRAGISVQQVEIEDSEFPFLVGVVVKEGDFDKLTAQLRKMPDYEYHGSISSHTQASFNIVPYRVYPSQVSERIEHRTGIRNQMFFDRLQRMR
jgi:hypothetical protein